MISTSKGRFDNVSKKEGKAQVSIQSSTRPDTNGKVKTPHLDITNETQEVSPFPTGDYKASINRRARKHDKNKTEITYEMIRKEAPPWNGIKPVSRHANLILSCS